jgi:hypothetical protein
LDIIENKLVPPPAAEPTRVITLSLPESRAGALASVLFYEILWAKTPAAEELNTLYCALKGLT